MATSGSEPRPETPQRREAERAGSRSAAQERIRHQAKWVDLQIRQAVERGEFDNLPGAGKPLRLPDRHDPDWWVKQLIEREHITGVAPAAITLRHEDAELDATLDREATESEVRRTVDDFNRRVIEARRQLTGGPPVVTPTRDPDAEVEAWRARRAERRAAAAAPRSQPEPRPRRRWFRRGG
jgi:Domain of unknown function (DUF1992)